MSTPVLTPFCAFQPPNKVFLPFIVSCVWLIHPYFYFFLGSFSHQFHEFSSVLFFFTLIFLQNTVPIKKFQGTKTWPKNLRIKGRFWKDVHTQEGVQEYLNNHSYERQKCRQHLGPNMSLFLPQWHCMSVLLQTFAQFSLSLFFLSL